MSFFKRGKSTDSPKARKRRYNKIVSNRLEQHKCAITHSMILSSYYQAYYCLHQFLTCYAGQSLYDFIIMAHHNIMNSLFY